MSRCPKTKSIGSKRLNTTLFGAVIISSMEIFSNLGLVKGNYIKVAFHTFKRKGVRSAETQRKEAASAIKSQKQLAPVVLLPIRSK